MSDDTEISFDAHIRPLFRELDRDEMASFIDLWAYEDVRDNASAITERLEDQSMPCDKPWSADQIDLFQRWVNARFPR
jgi:hypothetical protein